MWRRKRKERVKDVNKESHEIRENRVGGHLDTTWRKYFREREWVTMSNNALGTTNLRNESP